MCSWDPIGVRDEPFAADEYEAYIPGIKALLRRGTTASELIAYLDRVAHERMGFTGQPERCRKAAEELLLMEPLLEPLE
jgi:hypothetical protein